MMPRLYTLFSSRRTSPEGALIEAMVFIGFFFAGGRRAFILND